MIRPLWGAEKGRNPEGDRAGGRAGLVPGCLGVSGVSGWQVSLGSPEKPTNRVCVCVCAHVGRHLL